MTGRVVPVPRRIRDAAEAVLFKVREIPLDFDRKGVAARLERSMASAYVALDQDPETPAHYEGLSSSVQALVEARGMLLYAGDPTKVGALGAVVALLDGAIREGAVAIDALAVRQLENRHLRARSSESGIPKPKPFRASIGLPELHVVPRLPVMAEVDVAPIVELAKPGAKPPPQVPRPKTLDELKAFADAASSGALAKSLEEPEEDAPADEKPELAEYAYLPAIEEAEGVRVLARDALEDVASLSNLRHPIPTETWLDQGPFEQRLLDNVDYFASLGSMGLTMVPLYHAEAEIPDPSRAFAVAFTLGCVSGRDAVDVAIATLKVSPKEEAPGWVEGFWLAPNPIVDEALVELLEAPQPFVVGVALDALAARGTLPVDAPERILPRGDPDLTLKLVRALGSNLPKRRAHEILEDLVYREPGDELFLAAATSLLRRGHGGVRDLLRPIVERPNGLSPARVEGATWLLALSGTPADAARLIPLVRAMPSPRGARALGRFGHLDAVTVLWELLQIQDAELTVEAAAESLERITGAGLVETVEEPWDVKLPPEAREAGGIPVPMRKVKKVIQAPEPWAEWGRRELPKHDPSKKHRGGRPFLPQMILAELEDKATPERGRQEATEELVIATGLGLLFSPSDWVARQKQRLGELRSAITGGTEGAWYFAGAGASSPRR